MKGNFQVISGGRQLRAACYFLELTGVRILLDCGASVDGEDNWSLPQLDKLARLGGVDLVFVSHAHVDHVGGLPAVLELFPHATIISTRVTRELAVPMLNQLARQGKHYSFNSLSQVWHNWITAEELGCWLSFGQPLPGSSLRLGFWPAGHIPGAAMLLLEGDGENWLYTGDFSLQPTLLTSPARLPADWRPDCVISESTYATRSAPARQHVADLFLMQVEASLSQGGTVLIPAFALGRSSQEILLLLERHWRKR
ncbi:MBL fold metallo-hydrolase [Carboxydocella sp. JDF658]|uniref:MBL fold metallo-hydrolase n=1 Tax=Carboxydocella sp. JDF658 TaxID=1926600 RepID=UPI0009D113D1|nr:MBL fold metallo-hydrolase [Carboxydocella sp. JDF658]GAW32187.1 MBL fold hydrolase [Carboxydocella sp. JDF658]